VHLTIVDLRSVGDGATQSVPIGAFSLHPAQTALAEVIDIGLQAFLGSA